MPGFTPIAVVGVSALLPGSKDVDGFWRSVLNGQDMITEVPASHWLVDDYYDPDPKAPDKTYGKRGAFLDPVDFDPLAYGVPPNQLPATDTTQLLSLLVADGVLADVGSEVDRDRVSVILGTAPLELLATMASRLQRPVWLKALRESGINEVDAQAVCDRIADHYVPWQEASFPGLLSNVVAGRIANRFDLHGTNCTTDAACASSLAALSAGVNELALGQADLVITGGVDTLNDITMYMCFSKTPALSPSGDCRPFSDTADGTILGEGLVMFALKRLADAERDGDHVYAVLKGIGTASDGRSTAIYAPLAEGQARALRRAYASAGYGPDTVELVEAHGTGTTAGDLAEFTALRTVFAESGRPESQWCALGSVKSQIGHTKSAAGAAGMLKAVLALNHKVLPPTIKVDRPNPALDLESSPLYLNTRTRPWIRDSSHPRRASVSSFGFGGSNFHLTLEEYMPGTGSGRPAWRAHTAPAELVLLSAASPAELLTRASRLDFSAPLADVARETQSSFVPTDTARLSVVASSTEDLVAKVQHAVASISASPGKSFTTAGGVTYGFDDPVAGRIGFLFSGQGSQYVGMGADLAMEFPAARGVWDACAGVKLGDRPLHSVVFPIPAFTDEDRAGQQTALTATEWAQPALAAQSLAQLALLDALKISPEAVAGHSFGELVALHTAGVFDAPTLLRLARRRGEAMRDAASVAGAMLAVSGIHAKISALMSDVDDVWVANHNAPDQVVVSGSVSGIATAERKFAAAGLTCRRLETATAFHSPLVAPAVVALREYLDGVEVGAPRIDVFGNTDAAVYPAAPEAIRARLAEHVAAPVRFADEIEAMYAAGVRTFVEVGAGSTLTTLTGRILAGRPHLAVSLDRKGRHGVTALYEALGRLAAHGVAAEFDALWSFNAPPVDRTEAKQPRMSTKLSGANYGKPYPPAGGAASLPAPVAATVTPPEPEPVMPLADDVPERSSGLEQLVLDVVAEKTGYPVEMLEGSMELEADLGIDSIKRVEILSAVRRAVPDLPEVDPVELGKLRSLGEITDRLRGDRPNTVPAREEPVLEPDPGLEMLVLGVVAEKTGYPVEMLEGSMELEADLGIDSIKRVEILSAVRRAVPDLPEVDPVELGKLRSLGEIVDRLRTSGDVVDAPVESALARYAVRAVETPAPGFGLPGLWNGTIVVTDDGRGVARHVVTRFKAHGVDAKVHSGSFERAHGLIHLGGLKDVPDVDAALEIQRDVFATARTVAERSGVFVTVQDTGGDFGTGGRYPDRAWLGGIAGLTRTAAREWPGAAVKAIDCERGNRTSAAVADAIVRELLNGGTARDVGLRADGTRTTVEAVPAHAEPGHARITKESVIVATGGARGVTAEAIVELAERWQPKIVLLGRTPLAPEPEYLKGVTDEASLKRLVIQHAARPPLPAEVNVEVGRVRAAREIQATLDRIRATGAKVRYEAVDVRDHRKLGETLDNVRRQWGPITGIVHGAGVLADKCIAEKTDLQFERVFDTKVRGLRVLLEATESDPLDVLVMFSSISAHVGNPGQSDYAMANEVLNQVAHAQRAARPGLLVRTIAWGPWEGGMVGPSLAEHFRRQGVPLIPVRAGARAFTAELAGTSADTHVVITAGDTGPINGVASGQSKGEVQISQRSHPYLADHDIQGMPVVPLAMALEWFAGAGGELKDVRVLRKIDLKHYTAGGDRLTVLASDDHLELLGTGLTKHYQATAESGLPAPRQWTSPGNLRPVHADIYDGGVLFHGPQFQVIREILGISDQGAAAIVAGAREMGWPGTGWHTDPAAVDGGLQLALLWAEQVLGRASLPMGVAEVRTHQAGLSEGWTRCVVKAGDVRAESAECDIAFLAEDGSVRAELLGVSLIARPGGV